MLACSACTGLLGATTPAGATSPGSVGATEVTLPSGAGAPLSFSSIQLSTTCASASWCVSVGAAYDPNGWYVPLALTYSSGSWSSAALPLPGNSDPLRDQQLYSVSCASAGSCVAVGVYYTQSYGAWPLIETLSSGSWTATSGPEPSGAGSYQDVQLESVSCPSAGSCVAGGQYYTASGDDYPFVDSLSGGTWSATALSLPSGDTYAGISSVSCGGSTASCVAVGTASTSTAGVSHGIVETFSGSSWSDQNAPLPSGANTNANSSLSAVSCWASGACEAGGWYETSGGDQYPLAIGLSGSWSAQTTPDVASAVQVSIDALSCYSASDCTMVGYYADSSGRANGAVETYNGSSWSGATGAEPSNAGTDAGGTRSSELYAVSCPSSSTCVAIGYYEDSNGYEWGLIDTLSGSSQSAAAASEPSNAGTESSAQQNGSLSTVACASASTCVSAGFYQTSTGYLYNGGLLEVLSGGVWSPSAAPSPSSPPSDPGASVTALSCPTASFCAGVGYEEDSSAGKPAFAVTLSQGSWVSSTLPEPADAGNDSDGEEVATVAAISCPAAGTCVAGGDYRNTSGHIEGLIETLSGGSWIAATAPVPPDALTSSPNEDLEAISCPAVGVCIAVGRYETSSDKVAPFIASLSGGAWSVIAAPEPGNAGTGFSASAPNLTAVSCPSTTSCVATGSYLDTSSKAWGLIEAGSGTSWSATEAPEPSNAAAESTQSATVLGLSCPAAASCVAVGDYKDTSGHTDGLIETLASGTWSPTEAAEPAQAGGSLAELMAVSCPTTSVCTAVGEFTDSSGYYWGLIDALSGGTWSATEAAEPANAGTDGDNQEAQLRYVSCPSPSWCVAGGSYQDPDNAAWGYLQTGSGTSWTDTEAPQPSNASTYQLNGLPLRTLSCDSGGGCLLGGNYVDSGPTVQAMVVSVEPPAPAVSAVSPSSGPGEGGATVTVTGSNFFPGSQVSLGGVAAGSVTYLSPTSLEAVTTPGSGTVDVQVTTDGGTSPSVAADEYSFGPGSAGTLSVSAPPTIYWQIELGGYDQWASASSTPLSGCSLSSPSGTSTSCSGGTAPGIEVVDATGSGEGWALAAYLSGALPTGSVLEFDGAGSPTIGVSTGASLQQFPFAGAGISTTCDFESSCVPPEPASSCGHGFAGCPVDPVEVGVAGSPANQVDLYSATPGTGEGDICFATGAATGTGCAGTTSDAFFDLGIPASALAGAYASGQIVLTVSSGP